MPTQKKGCDDDEIVGLFSPQRRLFRKSKAAVLFRAKVSYRLMYILHESAMTPTHSSLGILKIWDIVNRSVQKIIGMLITARRSQIAPRYRRPRTGPRVHIVCYIVWRSHTLSQGGQTNCAQGQRSSSKCYLKGHGTC